MTVDFEIMPDIPEDLRGLHYWATPIWLSIAKNPVARKAVEDIGRGAAKKFAIKDADGVVTKFKSSSQAARQFGIKPPSVSYKIKRAKLRQDRLIKFDGVNYTLL